MMEINFYNFLLEYTFSGNWLSAHDREIAFLLSTREGTIPLDREFGINMDFLDMPQEVAKSLYTAEITKKIPFYIPTVRVKEVTWGRMESGKLSPRVVITRA